MSERYIGLVTAMPGAGGGTGDGRMKGGRGIVALCLVLAGAAGGPATGLASEVGRSFDGVWTSRGYGWLWKITDGKVERFGVGDGFCIREPSRGEHGLRPRNRASVSDDGQMLRLRMEDPDYFYSFDRLEELPELCRERSPTAPEFAIDVVLEMFDAHYAFFRERSVNWEQVAESAKSKRRAGMSEAEALEVLEEVLAAFPDSHVGLDAEVDGREVSIYGAQRRTYAPAEGRPAIDGAWNGRAAVALLNDARRHGDGLIVHGKLADDIGYLRVREMSGMDSDDLDAALDRAMTALGNSKAVIVDVSENDGGVDSFARRIARRFAAATTVAYSKHAGDYDGDIPQDIVIEPTGRPSFHGPVYLISGPNTFSAAEIFVLSMRALPNVVHLGETTDGALSDVLWKTLPNGWGLGLSNEVYLDSEGVLWEGQGIPPEIPMAISRDDVVTPEGERSVRDLIGFIRARL